MGLFFWQKLNSQGQSQEEEENGASLWRGLTKVRAVDSNLSSECELHPWLSTLINEKGIKPPGVSRERLFPINSSFHSQLLHVVAQERKGHLPEMLKFHSKRDG